jgi:chromosome segregation ATPase
VFIIPETYFKELVGVEDTWAVKEYLNKLKGYERNIEEYQREFRELEIRYQKEFKDLEWKHSELSKSYKELLSKHTKATKLYKMDTTKLQELETKTEELAKQLELKDVEYKKLKEDYELILNKDALIEEQIKPDEDKQDEEKDFWSIIKNRLGKKELASKDE